MLHPDTELRMIDAHIGYGVFATRAIPRGTITWILDPLDRFLTDEQIANLPPRYRELVDRYTWVGGSGRRILCWDFGRYMNHSCEPNSMAPGGCEFEIAIRDISAGEELRCDYGTLNLEESMECACDASSCRGTIRPEDFETYAADWDRDLRTAFPRIRGVSQPLMEWFASPPDIDEYIKNPERLPSVLKHRHRASP